MIKNLSFGKKLLSAVLSVVILIFVANFILVEHNADSMAKSSAFSLAKEIAFKNSKIIQKEIELQVEVVSTLAQTFKGLKEAGATDRESMDKILKSIARENSKILGAWTIWEPNRLDGKDSEYKNAKFHDESGRYIPWFYKGKDKIEGKACGYYEQEGYGNYYLIPRKSKKVTILDPYKYEDAYGEPVFLSEIASPIIYNGEFVGAVGVDLDVSYFKKIASEINSYGGYGTIFSNSGMYVASKDEDLIGKSIENSEIKSKIESGEIFDRVIFSKILNREVYEVFVPIKFEKISTPWAISVAMPLDRVLKESEYFKKIILISGILAVLILSTIIIIVTKVLTKPLHKIESGLKSFFKYLNREITIDSVEIIEISSSDEFGKMAKVINQNISEIEAGIERDNQAIENIAKVLEMVKYGDLSHRVEVKAQNPALNRAIDVINSMIDDLSENIHNILKIINEYSSENYTLTIDKRNSRGEFADLIENINQLGSDISNMLSKEANSASLLKSNSSKLTEFVDELNSSINKKVTHVKEVFSIIESVTSSVNEISDRSEVVSNESNEIKSVVNVIEDIVEQTNLLSINATIESARAGEHGRGFAVVSANVKQLAEKTQKSLIDIKHKVSSLIEAIESISSDIKIQAEVINGINSSMIELENLSEENLKVASDTDSIAKSLSRVSEDISNETMSKNFIGKEKIDLYRS